MCVPAGKTKVFLYPTARIGYGKGSPHHKHGVVRPSFHPSVHLSVRPLGSGRRPDGIPPSLHDRRPEPHPLGSLSRPMFLNWAQEHCPWSGSSEVVVLQPWQPGGGLERISPQHSLRPTMRVQPGVVWRASEFDYEPLSSAQVRSSALGAKALLHGWVSASGAEEDVQRLAPLEPNAQSTHRSAVIGWWFRSSLYTRDQDRRSQISWLVHNRTDRTVKSLCGFPGGKYAFWFPCSEGSHLNSWYIKFAFVSEGDFLWFEVWLSGTSHMFNLDLTLKSALTFLDLRLILAAQAAAVPLRTAIMFKHDVYSWEHVPFPSLIKQDLFFFLLPITPFRRSCSHCPERPWVTYLEASQYLQKVKKNKKTSLLSFCRGVGIGLDNLDCIGGYLLNINILSLLLFLQVKQLFHYFLNPTCSSDFIFSCL